LKIAEFRNNEKNIEIDRENKKLLNKLVEISTGKLCTVKKEKEATVGVPKSLNLGYRKRETERIEQENHAFAKRLFDKQANFSKKKLEEEYKNHLKYKKQIMRLGKKGKKDDKKGRNKSEEKKKTQQLEIVDNKEVKDNQSTNANVEDAT
jgi:hypothetical protein